jgi:hypothetical protein
VQARLEAEAQCLLVIIGATPEGKTELVGLLDGVRESAQSWRELLLDLTWEVPPSGIYRTFSLPPGRPGGPWGGPELF